MKSKELSDYLLQDNDPRLHQYCDPVVDFAKAKLVVDKLLKVAKDIRENVYPYPRGIEIAAPQIGEMVRVIVVMGPSTHSWSKAMINPRIMDAKRKFLNWEDCMSIENMRAQVERFQEVYVKYQTLDEQWHQENITDNAACDIQHGIDHLDGKLYFDRNLKYFIPLSIYRPLKDVSEATLNAYVEEHFELFEADRVFSASEMKKHGLCHPRQCLAKQVASELKPNPELIQ